MAFGFSIMVTASFGVLSAVAGSPTVGEILLFGIGAALPVAALEAVVTRGFRVPAETHPSEVAMLGTALNFASVAAGVGAALGGAETVGGGVGWPAAGFVAATVYMLAESVENLIAEVVQRRRGDPQAQSGEEQ